jgi:hypothetical protein
MLFSFLGILAQSTAPKSLSALWYQAIARPQSRALSYSTQVTVQLIVAREPRPKQPDEKAPTTPVAPVAPLVSRSFTGQLALRPPGSALITVNDEKRVERQQLTINAQTAVLWQAATKAGQPSLYKELPFAGAADSQASGGKDRLTFLLSKTALLDP